MIDPAAQRLPNLANGSATNSEKGAAIYEGGGRPTEARRVALRTPLLGLNLNWREKDLPEQERTKHVHHFHPYLGKYIPQLVEIFLRKSAQYDLTQARKEVHDILEKVRSAIKPDNGSIALWNATIKTVPLRRESEEYLNRWFAPRALAEC